ncbi:sarcolemmal membrane-associated [Fusarium sporotrichioides]|uniref:Sarcolemmal membrane-associated n=1 Tax=Fusarium sporotrichioides TaxID=5514 RepID=A0A395RZK9_FUSSP|nr:sarcolemmal membrane-associated [Fusarium sporotrichioides]
MAAPEYRDEVLITLSSVDPPPNFAFKRRHIFLSKKNPTIQIGRTSKRKTFLEAGKCNAWFDSAVMSRKHALLTLDAENQKVYIKDTNSLHGTYKNGLRLEKNEDAEISTGDELMFGTSIDRGMEKYPPTTLEATLKYGPLDPEHRGNTFRVPDESDCEGMSSDEDQVQNSCKMLYARRVRPAAPEMLSLNDSTIDLTRDEDQSLLPKLRDDAPCLQPVTLPRRGESLSQPISNDASTPSDKIGLWYDDEDEDGKMDDRQDEEMGEDSHMDQFTSKDAGDDVSVAHSESSSVYDVDENQDPESADNGFDEHDEFEEGMLEDPSYMAYFDLFKDSISIIDSTASANDDAEATSYDPAPAPTPSANSGTPKQKNVDVTEEQATKEISQPEFSNTAELLNKPNYTNMNELWHLPPRSMSNTTMTPLPLPSISAWTSQPFNFEPHKPQAVAETMGRSTGKAEFFAAREVNKVNAGFSLPSWPRPSLDNFSTTVPGHMQPLKITEQLAQTPQVDRVGQLPPCDLTVSGARFLNTPEGPFHQAEPEVADQGPVLDETSAFSFEKSKKGCAIEEPIADTSAHAVASQKAHQEAIHTQKESAQTPTAAEINKDEATKAAEEIHETPKPSKRKAEEISELIAEEELIESNEPLIPQQATFWPPKRAAGSLHRETQVANAPPPPKRLRRMAEVVGYATLGGVAVMSALIATAPAL